MNTFLGSRDDYAIFLDFINENPMAMEDLILLGKLHQLTSYDASYLNLALNHGLPIATLDKKLRLAANQSDVPLYLA